MRIIITTHSGCGRFDMSEFDGPNSGELAAFFLTNLEKVARAFDDFDPSRQQAVGKLRSVCVTQNLASGPVRHLDEDEIELLKKNGSNFFADSVGSYVVAGTS